MRLTKQLSFIGVLLLIAVATSGCIEIKSGKKNDTSSIDGGMFKTENKGSSWKQKVLIPTTSGRPGNFSSADVSSMVIDPNDHKAIYFGSAGAGLFYTYDGGDSWQRAGALGNSAILSIVVDPADKCTIYVTLANKVFRSADCSRAWEQVYYDNNPSAKMDALAVDHFNSRVIYAGINRGDIIKSYDGGESWQKIKAFGDGIKYIYLDPNDSRIIYAIVNKKGLFRSGDGGESWGELNEKFKDLKLNLGNIKDMIFIKSEPDALYLATTEGIVKSDDRGETWKKIDLISPEKKAAINSIVINPRNTKEIYYVTNTTFNRSVDGGENWTPVKLPTSRAGWQLLIDPESPNVIYMGVKAVNKK